VSLAATTPGLCKASLAATTPLRLQLCTLLLSSASKRAAGHYSNHTSILRAEGRRNLLVTAAINDSVAVASFFFGLLVEVFILNYMEIIWYITDGHKSMKLTLYNISNTPITFSTLRCFCYLLFEVERVPKNLIKF
jgi:hypothetical protein